MKLSAIYKAVFILFFVIVILVICANIKEFKQISPRYVKIVNIDSPHKAINIIFDKSTPKSKKYDVVCIDINNNGIFEDNETIAEIQSPENGEEYFTVFKPVSIPAFINNKQQSVVLKLVVLSFFNEYLFSGKFEIKYPNSKELYHIERLLKPSKDPKKPFIWNYSSKPELIISAKPGENTGIALDVVAGSAEVYKNHLFLTLKITDSHGKVIKEDKGGIYTFGFG